MDAREAVYIGFLQWPENLTISDWYKHLWPILSDGKKITLVGWNFSRIRIFRVPDQLSIILQR